jgi:hypothetical protein
VGAPGLKPPGLIFGPDEAQRRINRQDCPRPLHVSRILILWIFAREVDILDACCGCAALSSSYPRGIPTFRYPDSQKSVPGDGIVIPCIPQAQLRVKVHQIRKLRETKKRRITPQCTKEKADTALGTTHACNLANGCLLISSSPLYAYWTHMTNEGVSRDIILP